MAVICVQTKERERVRKKGSGGGGGEECEPCTLTAVSLCSQRICPLRLWGINTKCRQQRQQLWQQKLAIFMSLARKWTGEGEEKEEAVKKKKVDN